MRFRKLMLDDYLGSASGGALAEKFYNLKSLWDEFVSSNDKKNTDFYSFVTSFVMGPGYVDGSFDIKPLFSIDDERYNDIDDFISNLKFTEDVDYMARELQIMMPFMSLQMFFKYPEFAFPYLIPRHFYKLEIICREFGIVLPPVPKRGDYRGRANYYFDICRAMYEFRIKNNLSSIEMCVFFYGFAMRFVDDAVSESITRANRVFFLYANPIDVENFLSKKPDGDVTIWQGNPNMQPGDIVLLYEQTPGSCISSIWKTITPGFDDPFGWYAGSVFIGEQVEFPKIAFKELARNEVWKTNPLINAHMQGGSRRVCPVDCYRELLDMVRRKDETFDLSKLPPPPKDYKYDQMGLMVEHDVEVKLLEPFLKNLGFDERDWRAQFSVRVGRENASRPDYVVHVDDTGSTPRAEFVFEAKLSIPTKRQLKKDFGQATAYGRLLMSKVICLVAREGVWLSTIADGFDFDKIRYFDWDKLRDPESMVELRTLFH